MIAKKITLKFRLRYISTSIVTSVCLLISNQILANDKAVMYLDGDIEVRKQVKWNALGGSSVEYVREKVQQDLKQAETQEKNITKKQKQAELKTEEVPSSIRDGMQEKSVSQSVIAESFQPIDDKSEPNFGMNLYPDSVAQKKRLTVRTEDDSQNVVALLNKLKQAKLENNHDTERNELKLAPGEKVIEHNPPSVKLKQKKKVVSGKRQYKPENVVIKELNFQDANILDVAKALSDISGLNFVSTESAANKSVTVFLQNLSVIDALETITKNSGLWYRKDKRSGVYRIMTTQEYAKDLVIYREDITKVFRLLHPNPLQIANAVQDLYPNRVILSFGMFDDTTLQQAGRGGARTSGVGRSNNSRGRSNGGLQNRGNRARGGRGLNNTLNDTKQDLTKQVTSEQLANLESQAGSSSPTAVSTEQLTGFTAAQQPIYVTLAREQDLMIVRTSDVEAMKDIESLVKALDLPTKQVLLEMKILSLDVGDFYRRATDLDFMPNDKLLQGPLTDQAKNPLGTIAPIEQTSTTTIGGTTSTQNGVVNLGVSHILGLGNFALEGGTFVYQFLSDKIRARIQLLQQNNRITTLSSPILLTANKKPARVFVGVEQVVTTGFEAVTGTTNGLVGTNTAVVPITEVRDIGTTLQVQPNINGDKTVTLLVQQDASSLISGASTIPIPVGGTIQSFNVDSVRTSNIQGTVVAKDGLTIAIGGLIDSTDSFEEQKVPFISEFPIIGEFFKREVKEKSKRELILLITPHIIETPQFSDDVSRDVIEPITETEW